MKHSRLERTRITKKFLAMALSALLSLGGFAAPAPTVSAAEAEYSESGAVRLVFTESGIIASGGEGYKI